MKAARYWQVALALLVFDWGWGMATVRGLVPLWSCMVINFPLGIPYFWLESQWVGVRYEVNGRVVSELWSFFLFFFMVLAQAVRRWEGVMAARAGHRRPIRQGPTTSATRHAFRSARGRDRRLNT